MMLAATVLGCGEQPRLLSVVYVHGGTFRANRICGYKIDRGCGPLEQRPLRKRFIMSLGPFWADTNLVSPAQFEACQLAGVCGRTSSPSDEIAEKFARLRIDYVDVPIEEAANYCRWRGWRLPTPDEYERMARWTDGRDYAWGNGHWSEDGNLHKASPEGVRGLNFVPQWVTTPTGAEATSGFSDSTSIAAGLYTGAAFRCVYTPPWDLAQGVGRIVDPAGDPWVNGGPGGPF